LAPEKAATAEVEQRRKQISCGHIRLRLKPAELRTIGQGYLRGTSGDSIRLTKRYCSFEAFFDSRSSASRAKLPETLRMALAALTRVAGLTFCSATARSRSSARSSSRPISSNLFMAPLPRARSSETAAGRAFSAIIGRLSFRRNRKETAWSFPFDGVTNWTGGAVNWPRNFDGSPRNRARVSARPAARW
jgi:hypothetical protein